METTVRFIGLLAVFLMFAAKAPAQDAKIDRLEERMVELQERIGGGDTDADKRAASDELAEVVRSIAKHPDAYEHPFVRAFKVNSQLSPDKAFRIFNWNVLLADGTSEYRLFLWPEGSKKLLEAHDRRELTHGDERAVFESDDWYGALYYEIHPIRSEGRTLYTLVGWDGNDGISTKKVLDVLVFDGKQDFHFGHPVFAVGDDVYVNRRIFEYSADAVMNLRWVDTEKAIVFDRLEPRVRGAENNYAFYGPGTGYSGYTMHKGKWVLHENMEMARPRNRENDARFNFPDRPDFTRKRDTINPLIGR
ncbi:MAG TPA: hypothetical protein VKY29_05770 [Cryomorphaceae bacterium]|nr:hypothetical protein [Cryomorphaceae bacterium]